MQRDVAMRYVLELAKVAENFVKIRTNFRFCYSIITSQLQKVSPTASSTEFFHGGLPLLPSLHVHNCCLYIIKKNSRGEGIG